MKTATVKEVGNVRKWEGAKGDVYYHFITLDNGDKGSIGKKTPGAIKAGDKLEYTIEGDKIKQVMPQRQGSSNKPSTAAMALAFSKDIAIAYLAKTDKEVSMDQLAERTMTIAAKFHDWVKERE